mmetsp:Transcript_89352/g.282734  ORF Transcript_89352/g.282734 Transcript_89352/m.282734 type:complete len:208 (+) Transcript_89352:68-691(+)
MPWPSLRNRRSPTCAREGPEALLEPAFAQHTGVVAQHAEPAVLEELQRRLRGRTFHEGVGQRLRATGASRPRLPPSPTQGFPEVAPGRQARPTSKEGRLRAEEVAEEEGIGAVLGQSLLNRRARSWQTLRSLVCRNTPFSQEPRPKLHNRARAALRRVHTRPAEGRGKAAKVPADLVREVGLQVLTPGLGHHGREGHGRHRSNPARS